MHSSVHPSLCAEQLQVCGGQSVVSLWCVCVCESMGSFVSKSMACHFTFVLGFDSLGDTCKTAVIRRGCDLMRVPHALGVFVCT